MSVPHRFTPPASEYTEADRERAISDVPMSVLTMKQRVIRLEAWMLEWRRRALEAEDALRVGENAPSSVTLSEEYVLDGYGNRYPKAASMDVLTWKPTEKA